MSDTWDYRVVRKTTEDGDEGFGVQEVYYDDVGKPYAHTTDLEITGATIAGMRKTLQRMLWCLDKEVVDEIKSEISDYSDTVMDDFRGTVEERVSFLEQESAEMREEMESLILSVSEKSL